MVQSTGIDQADVVFLVEGTAINGAYMNDMKVNYVIPTLEYFSQTEEDVYSGCVFLNTHGWGNLNLTPSLTLQQEYALGGQEQCHVWRCALPDCAGNARHMLQYLWTVLEHAEAVERN